MKREILTKLSNDQPLTTEELRYVIMNLKDEDPVKNEYIPFDHAEKADLWKSCGLTDKDQEEINMICKPTMKMFYENKISASQVVESVERALDSKRGLRLATLSLVIDRLNLNNPLSAILRNLLGGRNH